MHDGVVAARPAMDEELEGLVEERRSVSQQTEVQAEI